jgi:hypothetical protein
MRCFVLSASIICAFWDQNADEFAIYREELGSSAIYAGDKGLSAGLTAPALLKK